MNAAPKQFTAAQIAALLGVTSRAVRWTLREVTPTGVCIVNGNETATWSYAALPRGLSGKLDAAALQRGYRTAVTMLQSPPTSWPPKDFPKVEDITPEEIERATKLRQALGPMIYCQHDTTLSAAEFETRGVAEYQRVFGYPVSARHWRDLFKRTLLRDAGEEKFTRLELYLPDKPTLKLPSIREIKTTSKDQFAALSAYLDVLQDPAQPSEMEVRGAWTLAFESYAKLIEQGVSAKRAARLLREYLFAKAAFLAQTRNALRMAFDRKLERWEQSQCDPNALKDGRADNGERFEFPEEDQDLLTHRAVFYYRGDIAPAWRDCLRSGFSIIVRNRYAGKAADKSHVPQSVMDLIGPEVDVLTTMHRGPRAFDSIKGHVSRNYDGISSLQCLQADDFTLNTYFYVPDDEGWFKLTRGQVILFIDFRTWRIVGWALEPCESYSSLTIRSLCTHIFAEFGVPEVLYFERGLWKSATLLKGKTDPFTFTEISQGLREFNIKFLHAIRPRSKTIERVGGLFQDIAEAEPGYCGRDERRDAPESLRKQMAEVKTRKVHPSKYFYSLDHWNHRLGQLVEQFNATPQQGKILAGLSPEQAFEKHLDHSNPPMVFGAGLRHLLAHDKRPARVTLNGVTIQIGKQKFNYRGHEIAHLVGRDVLAWFDPENSDVLVVTNPDRTNPICVARSQEPGALECLTAPGTGILNQELERIEEQASHMRTRFNIVRTKFPMPSRGLLVDAQNRELGPQIEFEKSRVRDAVATGQRQRQRAGKLARETGIVVSNPAHLEDKAAEARILRDFLNSEKESES